MTAAIRAEQAEEALRKAQAELAHVTRVTTLGELTASIAHEITQPLAAVISNADACIGWLGRDPADLTAARRSAEWIVEDANRASEVIRRIRALAKKTEIEVVPLDINQVVREAMALVRRELATHAVSVRMELASDLPKICGDRIQLQQVLINLRHERDRSHASQCRPPARAGDPLQPGGRRRRCRLLLTVTDRGVGLGKDVTDRIFMPFFTTKVGRPGDGTIDLPINHRGSRGPAFGLPQ